MKLDLGSLSFNLNITSGGGTPSWGTSLGQGAPSYFITAEGYQELIPAMVYCMVQDMNQISCPLGKGGNKPQYAQIGNDYDYVIGSLFKKVYVNDKFVEDATFLLLVTKENNNVHAGRLTLKYNPKISYGNSNVNEDCYRKMEITLGIASGSAWFVSDIFTKNQDELHFVAYVGNDSKSILFDDSAKRKAFMLSLMPDGTNYETEGKTNTSSIYRIDSLQQIFYGAPGTGKSHTINETTKNSPKENVFRTTFHPDSDYSTFIGCYKPKMVKAPIRDGSGHEITNACDEEKKRISYEFEPQSFLKAYVRAYETSEPVYLVIEEINRGNCAQIFGDMFQLLDRNENGKSDYRIKPETSIQDFLREKLANLDIEDEAIKSGEEMQLPANLYIWATMNTSDQSLFPIDSAFKRRWDWKYVSISNANKGYKIDINGKQYDWWQFLDRVNTCIGKVTSSEDKKLGYFFCKADKDNNTITADRFVNKVIFYIWGDVLKDYEPSELQFTYDNENLSLMTYKDNGNDIAFNFSSFFKADGEVNCDMARKMLENIGLKPIGKNDDGNLQQDANAEDDADKQANDNA